MCDFVKLAIILFNGEVRRDIVLCFVGLVISIIVFLAEYISESKNEEIIKKYLIKKSNVKEIFAVSCFTLLMLWTVDSFIINQENCKYYIIQILLDLLIFYLFCLSIHSFFKMINIINNNKTLSVSLKSESINLLYSVKKAQDEVNKNNEKFEKYIKSNASYGNTFFNDFVNKEDYTKIFSNKSGKIIDIQIDELQKIENTIEEKNPVFMFNVGIDTNIDKGSLLGYCRNEYYEKFKKINRIIIVNKKAIEYKEDLELFEKYYCDEANRNNISYDKDGDLFDFIAYLYSENYNFCVSDIVHIITENYINYLDKHKESFNLFTCRLIWLFISKNDKPNYQNLLEYNLYYNMDNEREIEKTISGTMALLKESNLDFYDSLLSNILEILYILIRKNQAIKAYMFFSYTIKKEKHFYDGRFVELLVYFTIAYIYGLVYKDKIEMYIERIKETINHSVLRNISKEDIVYYLIRFPNYNGAIFARYCFSSVELDEPEIEFGSESWNNNNTRIEDVYPYIFELFNNNSKNELYSKKLEKEDYYNLESLLNVAIDNNESEFVEIINHYINFDLSNSENDFDNITNNI